MKEKYYDKIYGCFLGKSIGGSIGGPFEGRKEFIDLPYKMPDEILANDDLDLQIVWLDLLRKKGVKIDSNDLTKAWENIEYPFDEYGVAKFNLKLGLTPPITGIYNNWFSECMGAPIRSEIWACVFPQKPEIAGYYAYLDSSVDHWNEGVYGEIFLAVIESIAFEEKNIEKCVKSVFAQNYPDFEVIILDDNSTDSTPEILKRLSEYYNALKIINNNYLPDAWVGKVYACQLLYKESKGEVLVFLDADTFHKEDAIIKGVSFLLNSKSDLVTVFPQQIVKSPFEKLIIPFMNFALLSFYPLIPFANGQFMIYKKEVLDKFNGFEKIKGEVLDDVNMANLLRINKHKVSVLSGKNISYCRMYNDTKSLFKGFIKNYFAIFNYHILLTIFVFTYLLFAFFYPFIMLGLKFSLNLKQINIIINIIILLLSYSIFLITYIKFNYPFYMTFLYHITILLNTLIGYLSIIFTLLGKATWKDRKLPKKKIKLI